MRVLVADKLHPRAVEELRTLPVDVLYEPEVTKETLESKIPGVGILIVRSKEVTRKAIESARQLNLIVRAGAETATIDVKAASERGIYVANCPGKNSSAVAELVFGLTVALDRRIPDAVASLRSGRWERIEYGKAEGLLGKTIGIAGLGAIGKDVASRAKAFGLHPIGWGKSLTPARAAELGIGYASSLEDLASKSDILTLHLALNDRTRHCVNKKVFDAMPKRAMFINCARPDLVDYDAMQDAIKTRGLRAAIDVVPNEPRGKKEIAAELFNLTTPSATGGFLYATPHIAASTDQAQLAIASETVRVIRSFLTEGTVPNVQNVMNLSNARFQLVIRMLDRVGTLANVLAVIKRHGINVEEITNTVFEGGGASCAKLRVVSRPSEAAFAEIRAFEEVLHVDIVQLPEPRLIMSRVPALALLFALFALGAAGCSGCSKKDDAAPDASAFLASLVDAGDGGKGDGGIDPGSMPTALDDDLTQRMQHLLEAISENNPDLATDAIFPRDGYVQSKESADPQKAYDKLVAGSFKRSVENNHRRLKGVEHAKYVSFELGHQIVQLSPGKKNFKMPLWRVRHSKIKFTVDGKDRVLDIQEMTAWRGAWYVTRLR